MLIDIDPSDVRPIYVQIMDEIRRAVAVGTLEPEDAVPSVRELSVRLRVNPSTVQQAYRELERDGVVYVRRGLGTFIRDGGGAGPERKVLAGQLAGRVLREAYRNGLGGEELIEAIRGEMEEVSRKAERLEDAR